MKATLKIVKQDWTGWSIEQPQREEYVMKVSDSERISAVQGIGDPTAVVQEIQPDSITIITTQLVPSKEGQGINLKGITTNTSKLIIGEKIMLSTPTMDAGITFVFELLEIEE